MRKYIYFIALICCALSASTSYAQKKVIKTMMIAGQSLLARCLRGHEADLREQWNV